MCDSWFVGQTLLHVSAVTFRSLSLLVGYCLLLSAYNRFSLQPLRRVLTVPPIALPAEPKLTGGAPAAPPIQPASRTLPPVFERVKVTPAYKAVSSVIEQRIVQGSLKPGVQLPTEQDLAQQFGVNRSTVREAIRQLEQEGLVERHASKRLHVTMPGVYDAAPRAARALLLHQVTFEELWQVALVLEPQAARLAAVAASPADVAELNDAVDQLAAHYKAEGSILSHAELDIEFHALIARISGNRALMLAREPINLLYRPSLIRLQQALPQMERRNLDAHKRIVKAIAAGDTDLA